MTSVPGGIGVASGATLVLVKRQYLLALLDGQCPPLPSGGHSSPLPPVRRRGRARARPGPPSPPPRRGQRRLLWRVAVPRWACPAAPLPVADRGTRLPPLPNPLCRTIHLQRGGLAKPGSRPRHKYRSQCETERYRTLTLTWGFVTRARRSDEPSRLTKRNGEVSIAPQPDETRSPGRS